MNAYVSEITVIKNLNSRIHKRLPTPNTANCIAVSSFKVMCPGMCDYGTETMGRRTRAAFYFSLSIGPKQERKLGRRAMEREGSVLHDIRRKDDMGLTRGCRGWRLAQDVVSRGRE